MPTAASPAELHEGMEVDFNCSNSLRVLAGAGHPAVARPGPCPPITSTLQKLEPTGIHHQETPPHGPQSQDHGRTLSCQLSAANHRTQRDSPPSAV